MTIPHQKKGLLSGIQAVKVRTRERCIAEITQGEDYLQGLLNQIDTGGGMVEAREMMEAMVQMLQEIKENIPPLHRVAIPRQKYSVGLTAQDFNDCYKAARSQGLSPKEAMTEAVAAVVKSCNPIGETSHPINEVWGFPYYPDTPKEPI